MKPHIWIIVFLVGVLPPSVRWLQSSAQAQTGPETSEVNDEVPPQALLTDRGTELAQYLRILRSKESKMGAKHPALPDLRQEIADVKEQLQAWQLGPNPFRRSEMQGIGEVTVDAIPAMNQTDLQQIVLILAKEVESLKGQLTIMGDRMSELERQASR